MVPYMKSIGASLRSLAGTRPVRGMLGGAALGATYGMFADDSSFLGGAFRGGIAGLTMGSLRGGPMIGAGLGALYGGLGSGNAMTGALEGAALGYGVRGLMRATRAGYLGYGAGGWRGAGRAAYTQAKGDAISSALYIGRTARNTYGRIRGIFV